MSARMPLGNRFASVESRLDEPGRTRHFRRGQAQPRFSAESLLIVIAILVIGLAITAPSMIAALG